jgi:hypothetical protein
MIDCLSQSIISSEFALGAPKTIVVNDEKVSITYFLNMKIN